MPVGLKSMSNKETFEELDQLSHVREKVGHRISEGLTQKNQSFLESLQKGNQLVQMMKWVTVQSWDRLSVKLSKNWEELLHAAEAPHL